MIHLNPDMEAEVRVQQVKYQNVFNALWSQLPTTLDQGHLKKVEKIYLVGCGDSFFASLAARLFYEQVTGLDVEPVEAMEFSRYVCKNAPSNSLVFAVSNSGRVSRVVEAILQARKKGMYTVALTGDADRSAAKQADATLLAALPNIRSALSNLSELVEQKEQDEMFSRLAEPGMITMYAERIGGKGLDFLLFMLGAYMNSLILLYSSAIHIGLILNRITKEQAEKFCAELMRSIEILVRTAYANLKPIEHLAEKLAKKDSFIYLGSGPAYAVACLSAAKLVEQPHLNGIAQYLEEWAHLQFFFTRPDGVPIFVIVPPGNSHDRALEQINGITEVGGMVIAVCDSEDKEVIHAVDDALVIQGRLKEEFIPWVYGVPGQLLAITFLNMRGQPPIPPPYNFKQMMQVNFKQIYASQIKED